MPYPASQFVSMEEEGEEEQSADEDQSERYVTCRDMVSVQLRCLHACMPVNSHACAIQVDPLTAEQIIGEFDNDALRFLVSLHVSSFHSQLVNTLGEL